MSIKYLRMPPFKILPLGDFRSIPAEISTSAPLDPVIPPRHLEYPQQMSLSTPELVIPSIEPTNDSPLALPNPLLDAEETEAAP